MLETDTARCFTTKKVKHLSISPLSSAGSCHPITAPSLAVLVGRAFSRAGHDNAFTVRLTRDLGRAWHCNGTTVQFIGWLTLSARAGLLIGWEMLLARAGHSPSTFIELIGWERLLARAGHSQSTIVPLIGWARWAEKLGTITVPPFVWLDGRLLSRAGQSDSPARIQGLYDGNGVPRIELWSCK